MVIVQTERHGTNEKVIIALDDFVIAIDEYVQYSSVHTPCASLQHLNAFVQTERT